jgi:hypothetical protein
LASGARANTVIVNANIKQLPAGQWIYYREQGGNDNSDSVQSFKGGFKFEIHIEEGEGNIYLFSIGRNFDDQNSYRVLFLDKETINISANGGDLKMQSLQATIRLMTWMIIAILSCRMNISKRPRHYIKRTLNIISKVIQQGSANCKSN